MASGEASHGPPNQLKCFLPKCTRDGKVIPFNDESFEQCHKVLHVRKTLNFLYSDVYLPPKITDSIGYHSSCKATFTSLKKKDYLKSELLKPYRRRRSDSSRSRSNTPTPRNSGGSTPVLPAEETNDSTTSNTDRYL